LTKPILIKTTLINGRGISWTVSMRLA